MYTYHENFSYGKSIYNFSLWYGIVLYEVEKKKDIHETWDNGTTYEILCSKYFRWYEKVLPKALATYIPLSWGVLHAFSIRSLMTLVENGYM